MLMRGDGSEGLDYESAGWDFFLRQMADWEDREKSWRAFREGRGSRGMRKKLFGKLRR